MDSITTISFVFLYIIIFLLLCYPKNITFLGGTDNCPPGYVVARCMSDDGRRICTPIGDPPGRPNLIM